MTRMIFMGWPALLKAKENIKIVSEEISRLARTSSSLSKKDIVNYRYTMLTEIDNSIEKINDQIKDLQKNLKAHRKYFETKSVFLRRHNRML